MEELDTGTLLLFPWLQGALRLAIYRSTNPAGAMSPGQLEATWERIE